MKIRPPSIDCQAWSRIQDNYSLRTEQAYVQWVRMFVKWHGLRHPRDMGQLEIEGFLAMLANERRVRQPRTTRR